MLNEPSSTNSTFEQVMMHPARATQILECNTKNRQINDKHVKYLAKEMSEGWWRFNGEPIVIDWNGNLQNGQHRLWACVVSNCSFETVLITGVDPAAFATQDTGLKRTGGQVLKMNDVPNSLVVASIIRAAHAFGKRTLNVKVPPIVMAEFERKHQRQLQLAAHAASRIKTPFWSQWLGGILFLGHTYLNRPDKATEMEEVFATGCGFGTPFHAAREFVSLHRGRDKTIKDEILVEILTRAWTESCARKPASKYNFPKQWGINLPEFDFE